MIRDSHQLRSIRIAYVFPGQPRIERNDSMAFYDRLSSEGVALSQFSHDETALKLSDTRGGKPPDVFNVVVDHRGQNTRLLVYEDFPTDPLSLFLKQADVVWECFGQVWESKRLGGQPQLTEVKIRMTAAVEGGDSREYLGDRILRIRHDGLQKLGRRVHGVGINLVIPIQVGDADADEIPLNGAQGNLRIESLLDDSSRLFLECRVTWPTMLQVSKGNQGTLSSVINVEPRKPSSCVQQVYDYMTENVVDFLMTSSG